jgi:hypothetical protein
MQSFVERSHKLVIPISKPSLLVFGSLGTC